MTISCLSTVSDSTYEENLELLGYVDLDSPSSISLYASTFAEKDAIADLIQDYNDGVENEEDTITYTDYVALLMSSITDIISGISYLLIAFVSISLVVSSIMIGIITYISVLERTKEIGILRAVGASKKDVSRVFNAETLIVGLGAGLIGIVVTLLLLIPINAILLHLTGLVGLKAALPPVGARGAGGHQRSADHHRRAHPLSDGCPERPSGGPADRITIILRRRPAVYAVGLPLFAFQIEWFLGMALYQPFRLLCLRRVHFCTHKSGRKKRQPPSGWTPAFAQSGWTRFDVALPLNYLNPPGI